MKKTLLFLLALGLLACEKQSELTMTLQSIDYEQMQPTVQAGSIVRLAVKSQSQSSTVRHITLSLYDDQYNNRMALDTVFADPMKKVDFIYPLSVPAGYTDTMFLNVTATAYANNGETMSFLLRIYVIPDAQPLRSLDNLTLYSAASGNKCGFSMVTLSTVFYDGEKTDTLAFYDQPTDDETLSRTWYSDKGLYFARFGSFRFADASEKDLQEAYRNASHDTAVQNLQNDDILLIGTANKALAAVKILLIADENGVADDRYVFSLKTAVTQP